MKKLGTTLLLALSMLSFTTACGKKDNGNQNTGYYQCGNGGYAQYGCQYGGGYGGQYGGQMCQAGYVSTQMGCLPQGSCPAGYGYHPQGYQGGPGCIPATQGYGGGYGGYNPYQQQYNPYQQPYQQNPYGGW